MQVNHGVASETSGSAAIDIEKRDGTFIISNNNRYDTAEKTIDGVYTPGSYSIIRITYTIGGGEFEETVNLPFFVSNMVNVDIYSRTITGEEYSAEVMRNITNRDVLTVTKDSSYTVYTEYMYSSNRTEFEEAVYVNKLFRFDNHAAPVIPVGTKLTMVDVTEDQPHVYYYEVKKQLAEVPLTDFKDEDGNAYKERDISRLSELPQHNVYSTVYFNGRHFTKYNRGVERYFIFVDCSRVATEGNLTELESQITPSIVQNDSLNNPEIFYFKERCRTTLSTYNPRYVGWEDEEVSKSTDIVSKNIKLELNGRFFNRASDNYWDRVSANDYNNSGKYLETAIYLESEDGDKILFPSGTRVKFGEDGEYDTIKSTSNVYYFKDGADTNGFALSDLTEDTVTDVNVTFDFAYAKMENLPSGNYRICYELVRSANKDFPMGDDTIGIIYSDYFKVVSSAEYGFRFDVDDNQELSYNIPEDGNTYSLNYRMLLNSSLEQSETTDKEVYIEYRMYKKNAATGEYAPYTDSEENYPTLKYGETQIELDGNAKKYAISKIVSKDEGNMEIPFELQLNDKMEATNYKIEATVYVNGFVEAQDYMIYSIDNVSIQ